MSPDIKEAIDTAMREVHEKEEQPNVVTLFPITGGKRPTSMNWLKDLEDGSQFLARLSPRFGPTTYELTEFLVWSNKPEKATWLVIAEELGQTRKWVHSADFSLRYEFIELLDVVSLPHKEKDTENGNNIREPN